MFRLFFPLLALLCGACANVQSFPPRGYSMPSNVPLLVKLQDDGLYAPQWSEKAKEVLGDCQCLTYMELMPKLYEKMLNFDNTYQLDSAQLMGAQQAAGAGFVLIGRIYDKSALQGFGVGPTSQNPQGDFNERWMRYELKLYTYNNARSPVLQILSRHRGYSLPLSNTGITLYTASQRQVMEHAFKKALRKLKKKLHCS